jgi:hypothetical protein
MSVRVGIGVIVYVGMTVRDAVSEVDIVSVCECVCENEVLEVNVCVGLMLAVCVRVGVNVGDRVAEGVGVTVGVGVGVGVGVLVGVGVCVSEWLIVCVLVCENDHEIEPSPEGVNEMDNVGDTSSMFDDVSVFVFVIEMVGLKVCVGGLKVKLELELLDLVSANDFVWSK